MGTENEPGIDYDAIEKLAKAATPGKRGYTYDGSSGYSVGLEHDPQVARVCYIWDPNDERAAANASFIAACDPATVLALVRKARQRDEVGVASVVRAAEKREAELREMLAARRLDRDAALSLAASRLARIEALTTDLEREKAGTDALRKRIEGIEAETMNRFTPEVGQMLFQPSGIGEFEVSKIGSAAIAMAIERLRVCFWNVYQREWDGCEDPKVGGITFRPYWWGDEDDPEAAAPNLDCGDGVEIRWYKYPGRSESVNREMSPSDWSEWLGGTLRKIRTHENANGALQRAIAADALRREK